MAGYIVRGKEKSIVISTTVADKLIACGNSDATLLYLVLQRYNGAVTPAELSKKLGWSEAQVNAAENALISGGVLGKQEPEKGEAEKEYTEDELLSLLDSNNEFKSLILAVEDKLGKHLRVSDLKMLAPLYDDMAMPADVIYLLVCHSVETWEKNHGLGSKPSVRQIQKEGAQWIKQGIVDQKSASKYLKSYAQTQEKLKEYLQVLEIQNRNPVPKEEQFLQTWISWGFSPEMVSKAYEQTLLYRNEMNWSYCNAILRNWHEEGIKAAQQVAKRDQKKTDPKVSKPSGDKGWMSQYTKKG